MSELINTNDSRAATRWKLLTGASALALAVSSFAAARAEDAERPTVWVDLGGQAERVSNSQPTFSPPFLANTPSADLAPMLKAQQASPYSLGLDGKISILPENSDWVFSAAVRYGKSSAKRHKHQQTPLPYLHQYFGTIVQDQPGVSQYGDGQADYAESHLIVDFQAGKDVGLGMFGAHVSSVISAGVRFANFTTNSNVVLHARPSNRVGALNHISVPIGSQILKVQDYNLYRHTYAGTEVTRHQARGIGPSVSWNASLPVAGNNKDMSLDFDWGMNAAVLFGRQRTRARHKTSGHYYSRTGLFQYRRTGGYAHTPVPQSRTRNIVIPNVGGFAGVSLKFPNAKFSLGYRADFFFGAIDGGIDSRKEENRGFFGPFATIAIGLGG